VGVFRRKIRGKKVWVIDRTFVSADAVRERYRRMAQVQYRGAAEAEERRIIDYWKEHGTILPLLKPELLVLRDKKDEDDGEIPMFEDAVRHYRKVGMPKLKPSTRKGYNGVIDGPTFDFWRGRPLSDVTFHEMQVWDTTLINAGQGASTRRNEQCVLRSIIRSVGPTDDGKPGVLLDVLPLFPKLPKVGRIAVEAPSAEDVAKLLGEEDDDYRRPVLSRKRRAARLAFALSAYAGLRASEVRALRRRDVDLRNRLITVRLARFDNQEAPPKSGHEREIPIADPLLVMLEARCRDLKADDYVAAKIDGTPWGDSGLIQALERACKRVGISGSRYHSLRHFFATTLFGRGGVDARTVQALLGHHSLEVTQRYAHHDKERARDAVKVFAIEHQPKLKLVK